MLYAHALTSGRSKRVTRCGRATHETSGAYMAGNATAKMIVAESCPFH